jgi:hypothetical protein
MKARTTLENVSPTATVAMILGKANPRPPSIQERASATAMAAHSAPQANVVASAQFREEILRRYEAPLPFPWPHGGLND